MQSSTVSLCSFGYREARTYLFALLFVTGNVLLPQLFHLLPSGGRMWLPIYFFTLVAAYKYGWRVGLLTAVLSPMVNSALFAMPPVAALAPITVKSVLLAVAAGFAASHFKRVSLALMAAVVLTYQLVGSLFEWVLIGSAEVAWQDFTLGIPGMLLQVVGGWLLVGLLSRRKG